MSDQEQARQGAGVSWPALTKESDGKQTVTLLVVEDNPGDLALVKRMLHPPNGFHLIHAAKLSSALEQLRDGVDLVLLDLDVSDSQGLDTLRKVRAHHPSVPIIVLTGSEDREQAVQALNAGAQDYLLKSQVDRDYLARAISRHLDTPKP